MSLRRGSSAPIYRRGGVRGRHVSRRHRHGRESSAGRLAHPLHLMRVVEACSVAAARGAAFVRPHCKPHIIEVHSAAACAASVQSPSAALNGYDGTATFHHTAYAASYTARSATRQATPQATPWRRFDKTGHGYAGRMILTGKARKSRNKVSVACNAIMSVRTVCYFILHRWAYLSGTQRLCTLLP